jgi:uncharacterized protein
MYNQEVIKKTEEYVKSIQQGDSSGHDWWHSDRARKLALHIGRKENADLYVVELSALLHDIADYKLHGGDEEIGPKTARVWLEKSAVEESIISHVYQIIKDLPFPGAGESSRARTIEGKVVQDADWLDALGAIGIARALIFAGSSQRGLYNPEKKPELHKSFEEYKKNKTDAINHFYEKLLLVKDKLNTATAKKIAAKRHTIMEEYLKQFFIEWDGMDFA